MNIVGTHRDNPARERNEKLTERHPIQSKDYHPERSQPASEAYAEGWDRIWGQKAERKTGSRCRCPEDGPCPCACHRGESVDLVVSLKADEIPSVVGEADVVFIPENDRG